MNRYRLRANYDIENIDSRKENGTMIVDVPMLSNGKLNYGLRHIKQKLYEEEVYRYCYNYFSMRGKQWWQQVWDRFSWLVCGYGEKLGRFVVTFLLTIIIPAIGYLFCGIKVGDKTIRYPLIDGTEFSLINFVKDFGKCLHFSIVTFSTVGYGNIVPSGISYIISAIQILIGVLFVALFTSIMLKKILR